MSKNNYNQIKNKNECEILIEGHRFVLKLTVRASLAPLQNCSSLSKQVPSGSSVSFAALRPCHAALQSRVTSRESASVTSELYTADSLTGHMVRAHNAIYAVHSADINLKAAQLYFICKTFFMKVIQQSQFKSNASLRGVPNHRDVDLPWVSVGAKGGRCNLRSCSALCFHLTKKCKDIEKINI